MIRLIALFALAGCEHSMGTYVRSVTFSGHTLIVEKCEIDVTGDDVSRVPCETTTQPIPVPVPAGAKP